MGIYPYYPKTQPPEQQQLCLYPGCHRAMCMELGRVQPLRGAGSDDCCKQYRKFQQFEQRAGGVARGAAQAAKHEAA